MTKGKKKNRKAGLTHKMWLARIKLEQAMLNIEDKDIPPKKEIKRNKFKVKTNKTNNPQRKK